MTKPFVRADLNSRRTECFHNGRWANADLLRYRNNGSTWVIKDFLPCHWLVRNTYGRLMVRRELRFLKKLQGVKGIPQKPFQLDAFALCYLYIPGRTLKAARKELLQPGYFLALERLVQEIHRQEIVHLDIRYMRNILITDEGLPALLDFQSALFLNRIPPAVRRFLCQVDISGVYKCWRKIAPKSLDEKRKRLLESIESKRNLWVFKGYPLGTRFSRREVDDNSLMARDE